MGLSMIRNIGLAQRMLIWAFVLSVAGLSIASIVAIVTFGIEQTVPVNMPFVGSFFFQFYYAFTVLFHIYCVYLLSRMLRLGVPLSALCAVAMFLPLLNLLCLLWLNRRATRLLGDARIEVGLLGASPADLRLVEVLTEEPPESPDDRERILTA